MTQYPPEPGRSFYDGCIKTYGAATRLMTQVWEQEVGEPMGKLSGYPKDRFRQARPLRPSHQEWPGADLRRQAAAGRARRRDFEIADQR